MVVLFILAFAIYMGISGFTGAIFYQKSIESCTDCSRGRFCLDMHGPAAFFAGIAWPAMIPFMLGDWLMGGRVPKKSKVERKHDERLRELEHQEELAERERRIAEKRRRAAEELDREYQALRGREQ